MKGFARGHVWCPIIMCVISLGIAQKNTIHQVTTMLTTTENVLFPGHNHLLTTRHFDHHPSVSE